nr:hypothetical protein [Enterobacter cloacae complex sp. P39RS]
MFQDNLTTAMRRHSEIYSR